MSKTLQLGCSCFCRATRYTHATSFYVLAIHGLGWILTRAHAVIGAGDAYENRTRVTAVKGRCLNRLTNAPCKSSLQTSTFTEKIHAGSRSSHLVVFVDPPSSEVRLFMSRVTLQQVISVRIAPRRILLRCACTH